MFNNKNNIKVYLLKTNKPSQRTMVNVVVQGELHFSVRDTSHLKPAVLRRKLKKTLHINIYTYLKEVIVF